MLTIPQSGEARCTGGDSSDSGCAGVVCATTGGAITSILGGSPTGGTGRTKCADCSDGGGAGAERSKVTVREEKDDGLATQ